MLLKNIVNVYFYIEIFFLSSKCNIIANVSLFYEKNYKSFHFFFLFLHEHVHTLLQIMFKNHLTLDSCWLGIYISKATFKF